MLCIYVWAFVCALHEFWVGNFVQEFGSEWQYFPVSICVGDSYDEKDNDDMDNSTLF